MNHEDDVRKLESLLGVPVTVRVGGESFLIRAFTFGQLPRVLKILGPMLAGLVQQGELDLTRIIEDDSERAMALCMLAINKPREWFDEVPTDDGVRLLGAIAEVNADFFSTRIAPAGEKVWGQMRSKFPALMAPNLTQRDAGPKSPSNSSDQATDGQIS